MKETKSTQKYAVSCVCDLPWSLAETPRDTTLGKTKQNKAKIYHHVSRRCQFHIAFWLGVGLGGSHFYSPSWDYVPFVSHLVTESLGSYVFLSCCVFKVLFHWNHAPPLTLKSFHKKSSWIWTVSGNMGDVEGRKETGKCCNYVINWKGLKIIEIFLKKNRSI